MTVAFGCPAVDAFFCWGMMKDILDIRPNGGVETKPLYGALKKLWQEDWQTNEQLTSDADGFVSFRGFHGDYSLRVQPKGAAAQSAGTAFSVPVGSETLEHTVHLSHRG
jgi:hypothetical protein